MPEVHTCPTRGTPGSQTDTPPARDTGHVRAREVSAARSAAKSRGARKQDEGRSGTRPADAERLRRRARFLRERDEAQELRDRVQPRRARSARMRQAMRMRTFRW